MSKQDDYVVILAEELKLQRTQILEPLTPLSGMSKDLRQLKEDMTGVKSDIKVIKAAIKDQGKQVADHEQRLTVLEAA